MALMVECTVVIREKEYEAGSRNMEVIKEYHFVSSTGSFSDTPRELFDKFVDTAARGAVEATKEKLAVIKGK